MPARAGPNGSAREALQRAAPMISQAQRPISARLSRYADAETNRAATHHGHVVEAVAFDGNGRTGKASSDSSRKRFRRDFRRDQILGARKAAQPVGGAVREQPRHEPRAAERHERRILGGGLGEPNDVGTKRVRGRLRLHDSRESERCGNQGFGDASQPA